MVNHHYHHDQNSIMVRWCDSELHGTVRIPYLPHTSFNYRGSSDNNITWMKCKLYDTSHLGGYPYPTEKSNRLIADHIPFLKFHFLKILITSFLVRYTYLFHIGRFCSNKESRHRTPIGPFFMLKKNRALSAPLCTQYKK